MIRYDFSDDQIIWASGIPPHPGHCIGCYLSSSTTVGAELRKCWKKCGAMWWMCWLLHSWSMLIIVTCTLGMLVQRGNSHFASYCSTSANCWEIAVKARIRHRIPKISWEMWDIWLVVQTWMTFHPAWYQMYQPCCFPAGLGWHAKIKRKRQGRGGES